MAEEQHDVEVITFSDEEYVDFMSGLLDDL